MKYCTISISRNHCKNSFGTQTTNIWQGIMRAFRIRRYVHLVSTYFTYTLLLFLYIFHILFKRFIKQKKYKYTFFRSPGRYFRCTVGARHNHAPNFPCPAFRKLNSWKSGSFDLYFITNFSTHWKHFHLISSFHN